MNYNLNDLLDNFRLKLHPEHHSVDTNRWLLIFAIFIASLGLNVNSPAVIIGAMLVSPPNSPIVGMGLAMGINDVTLLGKSLQNFGFATGVSLLSSLALTILFTGYPAD